jgi:hypothetical protein
VHRGDVGDPATAGLRPPPAATVLTFEVRCRCSVGPASRALTKALAAEPAPKVRAVDTICPGMFSTTVADVAQRGEKTTRTTVPQTPVEIAYALPSLEVITRYSKNIPLYGI